VKKQPFRPIIEFCEKLLNEHGDSPSGMGWKPSDADVRYGVMLDLVRGGAGSSTLLDFGCGTAHLLDYMQRKGTQNIDYQGLDVSRQAIELCRRKFPEHEFLCLDVLAPDAPELPDFDYIVMNGILTYKGRLSQDEMFEYGKTLLRKLFPHARIGLAFNFMSKQVDWEREDLMHMPVDPLLDFLSREISRHVVVRHDYGLYEYTVYVYRQAGPGGLPGSRPRIGPHGST
jgi:SAM-dependent methyltransferase